MFGNSTVVLLYGREGKKILRQEKEVNLNWNAKKNNNWDWKREKRGKAVNDLTANTKHASHHKIRDENERHTRWVLNDSSQSVLLRSSIVTDLNSGRLGHYPHRPWKCALRGGKQTGEINNVSWESGGRGCAKDEKRKREKSREM